MDKIDPFKHYSTMDWIRIVLKDVIENIDDQDYDGARLSCVELLMDLADKE